MALRQLYTAETMFIDDGITDGANFPPSSDAVYDALASAGGGGGIELVTATKDAEAETITLDASWNDAYNAITSGKMIAYIETYTDSGTGALATTLVYCDSVMYLDAETTGDTNIYIANFTSIIGTMSASFSITDPDAPLVAEQPK